MDHLKSFQASFREPEQYLITVAFTRNGAGIAFFYTSKCRISVDERGQAYNESRPLLFHAADIMGPVRDVETHIREVIVHLTHFVQGTMIADGLEAIVFELKRRLRNGEYERFKFRPWWERKHAPGLCDYDDEGLMILAQQDVMADGFEVYEPFGKTEAGIRMRTSLKSLEPDSLSGLDRAVVNGLAWFALLRRPVSGVRTGPRFR